MTFEKFIDGAKYMGMEVYNVNKYNKPFIINNSNVACNNAYEHANDQLL